MFNRVREVYQEQVDRAFKQAPWRKQTQSAATLAVVLFVMAIIGGFYLAVSAQAATAGRDLQNLEYQKSELILANDELRANLASLRSVSRLAERAAALGYQPADPAEIEYIVVNNYPTPAAVAVEPAATPAPSTPATLEQWLAQTLDALLKAGGGG